MFSNRKICLSFLRVLSKKRDYVRYKSLFFPYWWNINYDSLKSYLDKYKDQEQIFYYIIIHVLYLV